MVRLHLVGFPHTRVSPDFCGCAYTQKVAKFARMFADRREIVVYAPEGSEAPPGVELVEVITEEERLAIFGPDDPARLPDWPTDEQWRLFNVRAAGAIVERAEPRDLLLLPAGLSQKPLADALPHLLAVEPGVGYEGIFTDRCAFESHAWRHYLYGKWGIIDGRWFDTVVPNYFDPAEFPHLNDGNGDYLLFLGRLVARKGPHVAAQIAEACGMPLLVAGAGATEWAPGRIVAPSVTIEGDVEYVGPVGVEERAELLAGARALLVPTAYVEPFGGVAVEAMLAGTPAITSPWGAFSDTVEAGTTGFHFQTLQGAVDAVQRVSELDPAAVRARAVERFSLDAVAPQFEAWFDAVESLWGDGWYARRNPTFSLSS